MIRALHHLQLAMPKAGEAAAIAFYEGVLGFVQTPKPPALAGRGGVWFRSGPVELHLGVETPFAPAKKAHPAFEVASLAVMKAHLDAHQILWRTDVDLPDFARIFISDPFGNRIELLETRGAT